MNQHERCKKQINRKEATKTKYAESQHGVAQAHRPPGERRESERRDTTLTDLYQEST